MAAKKRAPRGMGTVTKRADGRWMGTITLGRTADDKQVRRSVYGSTQREVVGKLEALRATRDAGLLATGKESRVEDILDSWLDAKRTTTRTSTYRLYESYVNVHLKPALGKIKVSKLTPMDVDRFLANLDRSANTKIHIRSALSSALKRAQKYGLVNQNAAAMSDPIAAPRATATYFTFEEAKAILEAINGDSYEALYVLGLACGMRQGEILGLTWDRVDLVTGVVQVRQQLQRLPSGRLGIVPYTKSRSSDRDLQLFPEIIEMLRSRREEQKVVPLGGAVFTTSTGSFIDKRNFLRRMWYPVLKKAGVRRLPFHATRHSCGTYMLAKGYDITVIKEWLGHSDISITADIYAHVMPQLKREAAHGVGEALFGVRTGP